jgi:hypothetical protein
MVASNNAINNTVGASISGVTNTFTVTNLSNTASSAARETIVVGGGTAADPTLNFNVSGVTNWEMGIDNSVADNLTISQGTALGTNDVWRMTVAGERTMPLQPAFLAFLGTTDANVTGNGTTYTLGSGNALTEIFDQGADFTTAGVFTAPVTGRYFFTQAIQLNPVVAAQNQANFAIVTSNRTYFTSTFNSFNCFNVGGGVHFGGTAFTDMDAADTCVTTTIVVGGAQTIGAAGGTGGTYFSGFLVV